MKIYDIYEKSKLWIFGILGVILVLIFMELSEDLFQGTKLALFDSTILNQILSIRSPVLNDFFILVTNLASPYAVAIALLIICTVFYYQKNKYAIFTILFSSLVFAALSAILKNVYQRVRPLPIDALVNENTFSFPSGHTLIAMTLYGVAAYLLYRHYTNNVARIIIFIFAIIIIGLIGFSRIYLGAHWATDVIASYLLGGSWLCFLIILYNEKYYVKLYSKKLHDYIESLDKKI